MAVCYRHPGRETGVSCSNCGRPICPDCMTATPVGMRCPECSRQKTPVRTMRNVYAQPTVTYVLIGICVLLYLGTCGRRRQQPVYIDLGTLGSARTLEGGRSAWRTGEYWRLVTGALPARRHSSTSPSTCTSCTGSARCSSRCSGTCASRRSTSRRCWPGRSARSSIKPHALTVGASGAVFGLMAAAFVFQRARGIDPWRSGLGPVILLNLALPFVLPEPEHLDRRAHRRPDRRRDRGARDRVGVGAAIARAATCCPVLACARRRGAVSVRRRRSSVSANDAL